MNYLFANLLVAWLSGYTLCLRGRAAFVKHSLICPAAFLEKDITIKINGMEYITLVLKRSIFHN